MSKKIKLAFDVGASALKIAVWRGKALELHEVPMPENLMEGGRVAMPHAFSGFLRAVRRELRLPGGPAAMALPSGQAICRLVTLPRMTVEQLELNLPYEFNDFIHGEPSQYFCDYALCAAPEGEAGEEPQEMTMMAAAVERQLVRDYVRMFSAAGFNLRRILPQEMALIQLSQAHRALHPEAAAERCFIDLGYQSTRICLIRDDRLQAVRQVPVGCRDLDQAIGDVLHIDPRLADPYRRSDQKGVLSHPACQAVYDRVGVEVLKVVNFYRYTYRQNQLGGVYLIGGGANIPALRRTLEERVELPALPASELMSVGEDDGLAAACACAAGAAVRTEEG